MKTLVPAAAALSLAGCALFGPAQSADGPQARTPISCPATCQTTYTQCSGGCIGAGETTTMECEVTCDRVLEECLRRCEKAPATP